MGLITLLLTNCQPSAHTNDSITPLSTSLEGRWQADSALAFFYHPPHRFINKAKPLPIPGEMLTVQANRAIWHYAGYKDQEHIYTRRGNTLFVQQNLVGEREGHVDTMLITKLTIHSLVLRDSTTDPGGDLVRVWFYYYSR
jgi:hypothetical protein